MLVSTLLVVAIAKNFSQWSLIIWWIPFQGDDACPWEMTSYEVTFIVISGLTRKVCDIVKPSGFGDEHVFVDSNVGFRTFHVPWEQKLSVLSFEVTDLLPQFSRKQSATGSALNSVCFLGQPCFEETWHCMRKRSSLVQTSTSWEFWFIKGTCLTVCPYYHSKYQWSMFLEVKK